MAQRQNTFNQFPSNDLADLNDNTMAVDEFANSQNDYALDRFGRKFTTLHKIIADINKISDEIRVGALPATRSVVNGTPIYTVGDNISFEKVPTVNGKSIITDLTDVNNKINSINTNLNILNNRAYVVESYHYGTEWYRVYSDGYIEQSGALIVKTPSANEVCGTLINLLKPMSTQNYGVSIDKIHSGAWGITEFAYAELYQSAFWLASYSNMIDEGWIRWTVRGY